MFRKLIFALYTLSALQGCTTPPIATPEANNEEYCTISQFYFLGEMGFPAKSESCPVEKRSELTSAYDHGRILYGKKQRAAELRKQIAEIEDDNSVVADISRASALLGGNGPTHKKEVELQKVQGDIEEMVKSAPDSAQYCAYEMAQKDQAKKLIPAFLLNMSTEAKMSLSGCSRLIR